MAENNQNGNPTMGRFHSIDNQNAIVEVPVAHPEATEWIRMRRCVFIVFAFLQVFVNYDVGAMAIMINWLQKPYDFSNTDLGILSSLTYAGLIAVSPFVGSIFTYYNVQRVIGIGLVLNAGSLIIFVFAYHKWVFFISRFLVGSTQAFFIIYAPVWVGCFAPETSQNMWMAVLQGSIVAGVMVGYSCTALCHVIGEEAWRYSFAFQALVILVLCYAFMMAPVEFVDLKAKSSGTTEQPQSARPHSKSANIPVMHQLSTENTMPRAVSLCSHVSSFNMASFPMIGMKLRRSKNGSNLSDMNSVTSKARCISEFEEAPDIPQVKESLIRSFFAIITNPIFLFATLAVSVLYYILTAIHYWMTKVLLSMFDAPEHVVYIGFTIVSTTAPVFGVIFGSFVIDKINCKCKHKVLISDTILFIWAVICVALGGFILIWPLFYNIIICVWFILFFGGCILPPLTLVSIKMIREPLRPLASSINMCLYHIFGYIGGATIPGIIMDLTGSDSAALPATFFATAIGAFSLFGILLCDYFGKHKQLDSQLSDNCIPDLQRPAV
ncbi:bifunctional Major facilitator superfamily/Major facilitator superfamily domain/MFS transporter superfamily/Protein spinster-like [Babesia duncani]|uniref:Bifunctional Major facilitator superfamily/Major facilitator superfamily domain/MFS transporter superfamily/Protein spinster-like n=1 Tax=Babesia duncani TaxID=323732 RepID=A0AAD9PHE2_9APIC|nr:bifunctional Major facilitator superfamily/Major facilitator superfamily domain/MFS transporter superfamily/Protein spinster-like [Babesia duncani]KAK2194734.1 bifunctional Major facilitator superfamily/Major facilitator superfamily domain/MFS transporter superfamily/Protein spinster-like [Babesia duncani]KAK2197975.1 bifunctional Major facilitator superfamily/Major facilitator superfamily domain/MFS transporter superfamily/Protein spinster-like [Babesia duncani]